MGFPTYTSSEVKQFADIRGVLAIFVLLTPTRLIYKNVPHIFFELFAVNCSLHLNLKGMNVS